MLPELLLPDEEPLLDPDPMQTPALHVWPDIDAQSMQSTPPVPQYGSICVVWQLPVPSQQPRHVAAQELAASVGAIASPCPPSSPEPDDEELDVELLASSPLPDEDPPYDELLEPPDDAPLDATPDPEPELDPEPEPPPDEVPWGPTPASNDE